MGRQRNNKKSVVRNQNKEEQQTSVVQQRTVVHAAVRKPLSHAAVGLASMMLAGTASAQPATTTQQESTTPPQQQTTTTTAPATTALPRIDIRSTRRPRARPVPAQAPAATVAPVVVDSSGVRGYQATQQSINRLPTPLIDTPQTVNVVTQQIIQDQRLTSMEDALRTVPGITFQAGEGGQQGDSPIIRGFAARGDIFRDGLRDPGFYTRDLFNADRVEVYKGPSAFAFGRGSTGGAINIVSKLPVGCPTVAAPAAAGSGLPVKAPPLTVSPVPNCYYIDGVATGTSAGGYRFETDANGKQGMVSARIAAMYQDMPTPDRDHVGVKRWGVAPSIKFDFTPMTRATLAYIYQGEDAVPDYGWPYLPAPVRSSSTGLLTSQGYFGNGAPVGPVPIPRNNWFGVAFGPLADVIKTETHVVTAKFEHDFAPDLKFVNATRYISNDRFLRTTAPRNLGMGNTTTTPTPGFPVTQMSIGRQHFQVETDNTLLINQTDLTGKFRTGSLEHTFATGIEVAREQRDQQRAFGMSTNNLCDATNALCRTSVFSPVDTSFGGIFGGYNPTQTTVSKTVAVYAFDQIKLTDFFEILGSIRYDRFETDFTNPAANPSNLSRTDKMLSWRVGAVWHPVKNTSVYAAYGISFNPSAEFNTLSSAGNNAANVQLDPERNTIMEVGGKAELLNGQLSLSGALFRIEKTNLRIPIDPVLNTALVLDGLARVDGVEVGVAGKLNPKWQLYAGFSYLKSEIVETTNLAERGRQLPNTPPINFNVWTTYDVTPEWTVGGGAQYAAQAFVNTTNTIYVPEYWKLDLMTSYKVTKNSLLQLNIYNLTDELYFAQYYSGHAVPASGRWASLSYRVRFAPEPPPVARAPSFVK